MKSRSGQILIILLCMLMTTYARSQTNIAGTVNSYTDITLVGPCPNKVEVGNPAGLAAGNTVIIMQMQGATINESNTSAFGSITAYNNSGLWEKAIILSVAGNIISFTRNLLNSYSVSGKAQLIKVPVYTDATVTSTLTGTPWNGTTGGVIAIQVSGTLTLNNNIDASGIGFRGGLNTQVCPNNCQWFISEDDYYYPTGNFRGAFKGEGIVAAISGKELGRGAQANGGGGGNDHNNGGGGGSNYSTGGLGGNNAEPGAFNCKGNGNSGRGGVTLDYTSLNKTFLAGGGGAGHGNNGPTGGCTGDGFSGAGGRGGGIVIIIAGTINGNGNIMDVSGDVGGSSVGDGAGGGGAGGTIILSATNYTNNLTLDLRGGNGGNSGNFGSTRCLGPGGGGGAGIVLSNIVLPVNVTTLFTGGSPGIVTDSQGSCNGTSTTATAGGNTASPLTGATIPQSNTGPNAGCGLPVTYIHFGGRTVQNKIQLKWATATEVDASHFAIERSIDHINFIEIGNVSAAGNTSSITDYSYTDATPYPGRNYYRLRQVDITGYEKLTPVIHVDLGINDLVKNIYPNPLGAGRVLHVALADPEKKHVIRLTDIAGREIKQWPGAGNNPAVQKLILPPVSKGIYLMEVSTGEKRQIIKLVIK